MKINKKFTTITPFSKYLALVFFVVLPMVTFFFGLWLGSKGVTFPF